MLYLLCMTCLTHPLRPSKLQQTRIRVFKFLTSAHPVHFANRPPRRQQTERSEVFILILALGPRSDNLYRWKFYPTMSRPAPWTMFRAGGRNSCDTPQRARRVPRRDRERERDTRKRGGGSCDERHVHDKTHTPVAGANGSPELKLRTLRITGLVLKTDSPELKMDSVVLRGLHSQWCLLATHCGPLVLLRIQWYPLLQPSHVEDRYF